MKKSILLMLFITILVVTGCSSNQGSNDSNRAASNTTNSSGNNTQHSSNEAGNNTAATRSFETAAGAVDIPINPERIVVLSGSYAGHALFLGAPVVAVDSFTYENPLMRNYLDDVVQVSADNLEQIIELEPDLIITDDYATNLQQLSDIAPTLGLTYGNHDYLTRVLEIGDIVNKKAEAEQWIADFKTRAEQAGEEIRAKHGEEVTVTVIETWDKELYIFGDNYARATEILYDAMKLNHTEKAEELVSEAGYSAISPEVLPEVGGDFIVFSKSSTADNTFLDTETFKNIPAVKSNQIFTVDAAQFYFNDPITLEYQLQFLREGFLRQ